MKDGAEMSAHRPEAWLVEGQDGLTYCYQDYRFADLYAADFGGAIVPLYRSPALTDAERNAIEAAMNAYGENNDDRECEMIEATLRGLLNRTK